MAIRINKIILLIITLSFYQNLVFGHNESDGKNDSVRYFSLSIFAGVSVGVTRFSMTDSLSQSIHFPIGFTERFFSKKNSLRYHDILAYAVTSVTNNKMQLAAKYAYGIGKIRSSFNTEIAFTYSFQFANYLSDYNYNLQNNFGIMYIYESQAVPFNLEILHNINSGWTSFNVGIFVPIGGNIIHYKKKGEGLKKYRTETGEY